MKKIVSLLLSVVMLMGLSVYAFAIKEPTLPYLEDSEDEDRVDYTIGTEVIYEGTGDPEHGGEYYEITVPSELRPILDENTGKVYVKGSWASNSILSVTVPETVVMECMDISNAEDVELSINFTPIQEKGSNTESKDFSVDISVQLMSVLFGEWHGRIDYDVVMSHPMLAEVDQNNQEVLSPLG